MKMENFFKVYEQTVPKPMWFFKKNEKDAKWLAYDPQISDEIERFYWTHKTLNSIQIVSINGKSLDFGKLIETSSDPKTNIKEEKLLLRGTWFFKSEDNTMIPYPPETSEKLENELINGTFRNVPISNSPRRDVIFHHDGSFRQYRRTKHGDPAGREVYRGWNNIYCKIAPNYPVPYHLQIFGVELGILMKHPMNENRITPLIFNSSINFLKENGIVEGIFRISGNQQVIDDLKSKWNGGNIVTFENADAPDVAGLLKAFVRQIPDQLIVKGFYPEWEKLAPIQTSLSTTEIINFKIELITLLKKLPPINRYMLKELFFLLGIISKSGAAKTKMTAENLATCWTPNLFPIEVISLVGGSPAYRVVTMMIEHNDIFEELI